MAAFKQHGAALITGGASGVGFAMASLLRSKYNFSLALIDNNADNLSKALKVLPSTRETKTEIYQLDVSDLHAWDMTAPKIRDAFPLIDILMLNAGASFQPAEGKQSWEDVSYFQKTFQVNFYGQLNGLSKFLSAMKQNSEPSAVIMTGSKQGITNPPGNPAYNASKSAVKTCAEHLSHDLKKSNPQISVHLLIPGWTFTGLSGNSGPVADDEALKSKKPGAWLPSQVATYAEEKMRAGKFYIICPDNDVDETLDQARMQWGAGDWIEGRPALSRWDDRFKKQSADWIDDDARTRREEARRM